MKWALAAVAILFAGASICHAQPTRPRVGWVISGSEDLNHPSWKLFHQGTAAYGFEDGRNYRLERRYADGQIERYPELFAELTREPVDIFIAAGFQGIRAAEQAARGRPVLAYFCGNEVGQMIATYSRPGSNITGVACFSDELVLKRLELLTEVLPGPRRLAYLYDPSVPGKETERQRVADAARRLGLDFTVAVLNKLDEIDSVMATLQRDGVQAILVAEDIFTFGNRYAIGRAAAKYRLAGAFAYRDFLTTGGMLSYGVSLDERVGQLGRYLGRLLNGTKPQDLPIDLPTRFELVINRGVAERLGIAIPGAILARADEVME